MTILQNALRWSVTLGCLLLLAFTIPASAGGNHHNTKPPLNLKTTGVLFAGGETIHIDHACPEGGFCTPGGGLVRVQHVRVDYMIPHNKRKYPIVTVPGYGVRATAFMGTLDGREGWTQYFARRKFAVYATVQSNVLAAGFNPNLFNKAKKDGDASIQPDLFHWEPTLMWPLFGFGPQFPDLYPETRFNVANDLDGLISAVSTADNSVTTEQRQAGITAAVASAGPSILMTHSQSGPTGFDVGADRPDLVKAHISIEPAGCNTDTVYAEKFKDIPVLMVFGDQIPTRGFWVGVLEDCKTMTDNINAAGGSAKLIHLPEDLNIKGNTHFMMVENNSDQIAEIIYKWIIKNVPKRRRHGHHHGHHGHH